MTIIECPFCGEFLEVEPPDRFHITLSTKPIPKTFLSDAIQRKVSCKNEECKKTVTVYWIAPIEYVTRL
jgi:hypothetical protein